MNIEELKAMNPSETLRNYVLKTGWTFTDMEKAALPYPDQLLLEQQLFWMRTLCNKTADKPDSDGNDYSAADLHFNSSGEAFRFCSR